MEFDIGPDLMASDDPSNPLGQIRSCYSKWRELKMERDALKSSLEEAIHRITELETTLARYEENNLTNEKERNVLLRAISTLHEKLAKEVDIDKDGPSSAWLNKAVEKLKSDLDEKSFSKVDANNSITERNDKETNVDIDQGVSIGNPESNIQPEIEVISGNDEFLSTAQSEEDVPKSPLLENPPRKTASVSHCTLEKCDELVILVTDFMNHGNKHEKSSSATMRTTSKCKKKRKFVKNKKYSSDTRMKSTTSNSTDSCSARRRRSSSMSSLKPQKSTLDKTIIGEFGSLWPCNLCDEIFSCLSDWSIHRKEHSVLVRTSITCEYCEYVAYSSKMMDIHTSKRHKRRKIRIRRKLNPANKKNMIEKAATEMTDKVCEISSSHTTTENV